MTTQTAAPRRRFDLRILAPLLGLMFLVILGASLNDNFLTSNNIYNVLTRSSFIGIIAVGMTFVIISGGIDLSVGSMAALISGVMIMVMNAALDAFGASWTVILIGMASSLLLGFTAGLVQGLLVTKGRIEAFIVTLGTLGIYRSVVTFLANGGTISLDLALRGVYRPVYYGTFLTVPWPIWVFALTAIIGSIVLHRTRYGRYIYAIGSNENVARYSAIPVDWVKTWAFVILGLCVSLATIIYVPRLGSASGSTGLLWELEAIAAVIIGGTALKGGSGHIWGTVAGAILLSTIGNVLNLTSIISEYLNGAVQGIIIILAVFLQRSRKR